MDYGQRGILLCQISRKYVCGIHFAHIMAGVNWTLSSHPLVKQTLVTCCRTQRFRCPFLRKCVKPGQLANLFSQCDSAIWRGRLPRHWPAFALSRWRVFCSTHVRAPPTQRGRLASDVFVSGARCAYQRTVPRDSKWPGFNPGRGSEPQLVLRI